jgi:hypothetical protein
MTVLNKSILVDVYPVVQEGGSPTALNSKHEIRSSKQYQTNNDKKPKLHPGVVRRSLGILALRILFWISKFGFWKLVFTAEPSVAQPQPNRSDSRKGAKGAFVISTEGRNLSPIPHFRLSGAMRGALICLGFRTREQSTYAESSKLLVTMFANFDAIVPFEPVNQDWLSHLLRPSRCALKNRLNFFLPPTIAFGKSAQRDCSDLDCRLSLGLHIVSAAKNSFVFFLAKKYEKGLFLLESNGEG